MKSSDWKRLLLLPAKLTNKYVLALLFFSVWMIFFDKNNLVNQIRLNKTIHKLEKEKEYYESGVEMLQKERSAMLEEKERFARERFFMHRPDEEVYVIEHQ